jgi:hypothetical protein
MRKVKAEGQVPSAFGILNKGVANFALRLRNSRVAYLPML